MPVLEKDDKKNRAFGPRKNSEWIREIEEACSIKPKRLESFALKNTSLLPIATITSISLCEAPYSSLLSSYLILSPLI